MLRTGDRIENPRTGQRMTFLTTSGDSGSTAPPATPRRLSSSTWLHRGVLSGRWSGGRQWRRQRWPSERVSSLQREPSIPQPRLVGCQEWVSQVPERMSFECPSDTLLSTDSGTPQEDSAKGRLREETDNVNSLRNRRLDRQHWSAGTLLGHWDLLPEQFKE